MDVKTFTFPQKLLEETSVLCLFGFDQVIIEKQLNEWRASGDREIVFFELGDFSVFERFQGICRERIFQTFSYQISPELSEEERKQFEWLLSECQIIEWQIHLKFSDYRDLGKQIIHNACRNEDLKVSKEGFFLLKDYCKGVPAFICGAGPSLQGSVGLLRVLQERGLIFAGGASISELGTHFVPIHIAAGVDPNPLRDRCLPVGSFDCPFFFQDRFSSDLLNQMHGPLFQVLTSSSITLPSNGFIFDGGYTVATFCTALAVYLGCNPIVMVGMDFAYGKDNQKYSSVQPFHGDASFCYEGMQTQKDWILAVKWLEALIEQSSEVSFFRVGNVGLEIRGSQRISLDELEQLFPIQYDMNGMIQGIKNIGIKQNEKISFGKESGIITKSLEKCSEYVDLLFSFFELAYPNDPTYEENFQRHLFALYREIVYQRLLEPLWEVWRCSIERNLSGSYEKKIHQWLFFKRVLKELSIKENYERKV